MKRFVSIGLLVCSAPFAVAEEVIEEVVVVAHPLSGEGLSQASITLEGEALQQKIATNIGDTLAREAGVHGSQFGKAVGRPVIHGLGGPRVRIMEDRIDTMDVSVTSADHAVSVDPFIAERIEVLKGASTLLYGSGAIGGVVDVHTGRIPHSVPDKFTGGVEMRYDNNNEGMAMLAKAKGGVGNFAWHFDFAGKDGDDYEIPGVNRSAAERAEDPDEENVRGFLPGSGYDMQTGAIGASYVGDWGFVGLSVSSTDGDYGLPGGHGHGHEEEEHHEEGEEEHEDEHGHEEEAAGTPMLELEQTRVDFELGLSGEWGAFNAFNVRLGVNDYEHVEVEPSGAVGSKFTNEAWELRGEGIFESGGWNGAVGFQMQDREFSAIGEEAFVPPVDSRDYGAFLVGEYAFDAFSLETGVRVGRVTHDPSTGSDRDFSTYSASIGGVFPLGDRTSLGVIVDHSSRAPVAEELFSNGPHLVTNAFERGNANLDEEKVTGVSATLRHANDRFRIVATGYYNGFSDYIYEFATGAEEDGLPVFEFSAADATFYGIDLEGAVQVAEWDDGGFEVRAMMDLVEAELDISGNDNVPRLPATRYGIGFGVDSGRFSLDVDYTHNDRQNDQAANEFETDSYKDLRVHASARWQLQGAELNVFLLGRNLTDDEQRQHTSFIKEFAPAPGRSVEFGVRLLF